MSAIITSNFRTSNAKQFITALATDKVYLFIGKSDAWSSLVTDTADAAVTPTPIDGLVEVNDAWSNMMAMQRCTDAIHVIPRHDFTVGATDFVAWDDADADIFSKKFYCITDALRVYKLLVKPASAATVTPTHETVAPKCYADGYVWKFMFKVVEQKYLTSNYIPVKNISTPITDAGDIYYQQYTIQNNAVAGPVYRYVVDSGGAGYGSVPAVTLTGDGSGATAVAVINGGNIVTEVHLGYSAWYESWNGTTGTGSGYNRIKVTVAAGSGGTASVRAVLSPPGGHGSNPIAELGAFYVETLVQLINPNTGIGTLPVDSKFRQVGLVKNPHLVAGDAAATGSDYSALTTLRLTAAPATIPVVGGYITNAASISGSTAVGLIDQYYTDAGASYLRIHQNDKTGYVPFTIGAPVPLWYANGTDALTSMGVSANLNTASVIAPFKGDILYVENRAPISRLVGQIEDIKMIIEF